MTHKFLLLIFSLSHAVLYKFKRLSIWWYASYKQCVSYVFLSLYYFIALHCVMPLSTIALLPTCLSITSLSITTIMIICIIDRISTDYITLITQYTPLLITCLINKSFCRSRTCQPHLYGGKILRCRLTPAKHVHWPRGTRCAHKTNINPGFIFTIWSLCLRISLIISFSDIGIYVYVTL